MLRSILLASIVLVAFWATRAGVEGTTPKRLKIEWFQTLQDEIDIAFLGSSHIYRQIDPAAFDQSLAAAGHSMRSFNFGVPGMRLPETHHMVQRILAMEPRQLQWLILEAGAFRTDMDLENDLSDRQVYWHDPATTTLLLRAIAQDATPLLDRGRLGWRHLEHAAWKMGNLGRGPKAMGALFFPHPVSFHGQPGLGQNGNGFLPLNAQKNEPNFRRRRQEFLQDQAGYMAARRALKSVGDGGPPPPFLATVIRRIQEDAAHHGVQIAWLLHPGVEREPGWRQLSEQGVVSHLLRFDEPETWPELYRPVHRFDLHHLNAKGAKLFSAELAEKFLSLLDPTQD